jgi:MFS family permease
MGIGQEEGVSRSAEVAAAAAGSVLLTLASAQFLMTLDSSVMNVSIATVAKDVGTTVTGIQTAITFYTLVMASLMITGGKFGQILGRKRAFAPCTWLSPAGTPLGMSSSIPSLGCWRRRPGPQVRPPAPCW